jgi:O-antigen ligase
MQLAWHRDISPEEAAFELEDAARRDARGHRMHLAVAALWCFLCTFPTSILELGGIPLIIIFTIRIPWMLRTWKAFGIQPFCMTFALFVLWQTLSLAWTPDLKQGLHELSCNRWFWVSWMLWPVVAHQRFLLRAIILGLCVGLFVQLLNILAAHGHLALPRFLTFHRPPNRDSGWWDPVAGGSMLVGCLGLSLAPALSRTLAPSRRALFAIAALATFLAILATGTRGAWIAGTALVVLAIAFGWFRRWRASRVERAALPKIPSITPMTSFAIVLVLFAVPVAASILTFSVMSSRINLAQQDLTAARAGNFNTDTGARLYMWERAVDAFSAHPLIGVGAGGYKHWAQSHPPATTSPNAQPNTAPVHAHAHSAPFHIAATLGLPGLVLAALMLFFLLRGGLPDDPPAAALAILGLFLVSAFDPVHINQQTDALIFTILPFCFISRPRSLSRGTGVPPVLPSTEPRP